MNNITIDAPSGDVVVKTMIKHIMPNLHDSGILKTVHRILKDYNGPKMSTRLINGRFMTVATLGLCYDILDRISGPSWCNWRASSGNEFIQALRESVEHKRSSGQIEQPQPQEQVEEVKTKASLLQKALRSINIVGSFRIDEASREGSIIDLIRLLCPEASRENDAHMLTRVLDKENGDGKKNSHVPVLQSPTTPIADRVAYIKINGKGNVTPVSDAKTMVEVIWMLPAGAAKEFRRQSALTITRVLGGDVTLCDEIEQRCARLQSTQEGRDYQSFVLDQGPAKKQRVAEPFWFEHGTVEERRAFVSMEASRSMVLARKAIVLEEIDMYKTCQEELESINRFDERDEIEFADRIKDVQRRATTTDTLVTAAPIDVSSTLLAVLAPVDDTTIDPATGLLIATPKCSPSVRGRETSIPNEAAKLGIAVGEKAGQVGKVIKRLCTERYGQEAGRNIPKRQTTFRGKPFQENTYYS
ncbi:unnamed protein product, partial [Laminaria digitata]